MSWINLLGFAAAFTVLASFCMTTIVSLRSVAIASNLLFILYGMLGHIYPVFFLHLTLLPINLIKLHRIHHRPPQLISRPKGARFPA
jgi:CRP/FNR family cyclic AMP-dependent transcriptional regulator